MSNEIAFTYVYLEPSVQAGNFTVALNGRLHGDSKADIKVQYYFRGPRATPWSPYPGYTDLQGAKRLLADVIYHIKADITAIAFGNGFVQTSQGEVVKAEIVRITLAKDVEWSYLCGRVAIRNEVIAAIKSHLGRRPRW